MGEAEVSGEGGEATCGVTGHSGEKKGVNQGLSRQ